MPDDLPVQSGPADGGRSRVTGLPLPRFLEISFLDISFQDACSQEVPGAGRGEMAPHPGYVAYLINSRSALEIDAG